MTDEISSLLPNAGTLPGNRTEARTPAANPAPEGAQATQGTQEPDWETFYARLQARQKLDAQAERDRDLDRFARSPECGENDATFDYLDTYCERSFGIRPNRGNYFNKDLGEETALKPFASAERYLNALMLIKRHGYEAIASDRYRAATKAEATGDLRELARALDVPTEKVVARADGAYAFFDPGSAEGLGNAVEARTDEEIEEDVKNALARVKGENFIATMRAVGYDFDDDDKALLQAALAKGDGMPTEYEPHLASVFRENPEKAARLAAMVDRTRKVESDWLRDVVWRPLWTDGIWRAAKSQAAAIADAATPSINFAAFDEIVSGSSDSAKYYWNDDERAEYARIVGLARSRQTLAQERGLAAPMFGVYAPSGTPVDEKEAKRRVDAACARRLAREALPRAEQVRRWREQLLLEDAVGYKQTYEYSYANRAIAGALSSVGYMATASVGMGAGFALNTLAQFQTIRDDMIRDGLDPDTALGAQLVSAAVWSAIEKAEFTTGFGKPLTGLQRKVMAMRIAGAKGARSKFAAIGALARAGSKELLVSTLAESVEEGLQGGVEGFTRGELWTGDARKAFGDALRQAGSDFFESLGSMALIAGAGTGWKSFTSNRQAKSYESLADFAAKRRRAVSAVTGKALSPDEATPKEAQHALNDVKETLRRHGGDITSALDELRERIGLDEKGLREIGDYLDLQGALVEVARQEKDAKTALRLAAFAGGHLTVGKPGAHLDAQALYDLVLPGTKVEDVDIPDTSAAPAAPAETPELITAREAVAAAQAEVDAAKVGSARRGAERKLRKARKRLTKAESEAAASAPKPTRKAQKVTLPTGESYVLVRDSAAPDVHTTAWAQSVAQAMEESFADPALGEGQKPSVDGRDLSLDAFKALSTLDKVDVAVTPEQYLAMTKAEREDYCSQWGLGEGGHTRILDETGRELLGADAVVSIKDGFRSFVHRGGNWELAHEHGHFISAVAARRMTPDQIATMRRLFGNPTSGNERWNEENANNQFAEWLRGKYDFKVSTRAERRAKMNWFQRALDTIKHVFWLSGERPPVAPVEREMREKALDAAFNALRSGDFSGLDVYAGIDFAEDHAEKDEKPAASDARKPAATASEEKAGNHSPKAEKSVPADLKTVSEAPAPKPAAKGAERPPQKPEGASAPTASADFQAGYDAAVAAMNANPGAFADGQSVRTGGKMTVFTPDYSMKVEAEAMWTPLASLVESTDDREVQMRDRTRAATDEQTYSKTRPGVFQPLALFPGSKSDDGAPIVGGGNRIISGHGRKRMLDILSREGRFGEYLDAVASEAKKRGLTPPPDGMENPVLVLRVTGGLDRRADLVRFAELSNRWGGLERSGAEFAESDARKITDALLRLYAPDASGNLLAASNRPFMAAFLKEVGATGLTNADGTPTPEAALRVQRALMTAVFGNDEKVRSMVQSLLERSQELSLATLQNALMRSAGRLLAMKRQKGSFDIVADVREAAYQYIAWRVAQQKSPKLTLAEHLRQGDFFAADTPPLQQALARLLDAERFGKTLEKYGSLVAQQAIDAQSTFGFFEAKTPLQLLGEAERALLAEGETPVTPDPSSPEAAAPEQTPPAVQADAESAPTPDTNPADPVEAAQDEIAPPEPETFVPVPTVRGTATLPGPGAEKIVAYQVNAEGQPTTAKKTLPVGAYNLLRGPYDVRRPPKPSTQDRAGRGLGIAAPPPATDSQGRYWGKVFPHFQGNKAEMADRTSQAIRKTMTKAERDHYTTVVDYFGGGGCWGLYHALTNFENARQLVVNEWEQGRIAKIRLLHEKGAAVADEASKLIIEDLYAELKKACQVGANGGESGSGSTIANKLEPLAARYAEDADKLGLVYAVIDCAHTMLANRTDANGNPSFDAGFDAVIENLREDGRKAKEAADAFKSRGGQIAYRQGDAASFADAPAGDQVVAVCDPPYYLTAGYNGQVSVPIDAGGMGWDYKTTRRLLDDLVDKGDAVVYTDEAWWFKESYTPDQQEDMFTGASPFAQEQEILLGIINSLDHFDVAGRVVGRQEVLGIHHGHESAYKGTDGSQGAPGGEPADAGNQADGRGVSGGNTRASVRGVARAAEGEGRAARGARPHRGREGRVALAREVIVQDIASSVEEASPNSAPAAVDALVRHSIRSVREDRMADYARTVRADARRYAEAAWLTGELPIPLDMRANKDFPDLRFSVTMGKNAREEAQKAILKYRPDSHGFIVNVNGKLMPEDTAALQSIESDFNTPKERKAALMWFCKATVRLPEDAPKITEALKTAERAKVDPMQFERPGDILEQFAEYRPKEKPINPDTVPELTDRREMGHGIVTYLVQDDKAGQAAMRRIINTHFGKDASPWCLLQGDGNGNLTDDAWHYWNHYNALPKRVAFKDGKLVAFMATDKSVLGDRDEAEMRYEEAIEYGDEIPDKEAWILKQIGGTEQWWDRTDAPHDGIPFRTKDEEGRTLEHELLQNGETSTTKISKGDPKADGIYEEWNFADDQKYHVVTERRNGVPYKTTNYWKNGNASAETFWPDRNKDDSEINRTFNEDGTLHRITTHLPYGRNASIAFGPYGMTELVVHEADRIREETQILPGDNVTKEAVSIIKRYLDAEGRHRRMQYEFRDGILTELNYEGEDVPVTDFNRLYLPPLNAQDIADLIEASFKEGEHIAPLTQIASSKPQRASKEQTTPEMRGNASSSDVRFSINRAWANSAPMTAREIRRAVKEFGTTADPKLVAYITPDGEWLDYDEMGEHADIRWSYTQRHRDELDKELIDKGDATPYVAAAIKGGLVRVTGGIFTASGDPVELGIQFTGRPDAKKLDNIRAFFAAAAERYPAARLLVECVGPSDYSDWARQYAPGETGRIDRELREFAATGEPPAQVGPSLVAEFHERFSIRSDPPPKKTGIGYKVFFQKNGKLYPPMVANPNGADTPVGVWLDADAAPIVEQSKTGRNKVRAGGKGTQGGSGTLAYRPGWHLGKIPYALQFNRGEKVDNTLGIRNQKGELIKVGRYFPADFVWAEVEYAADKDYQDEAMKYGINPSGKFQHSLAGLPHLPKDGSYEYRTNANPATDPWIITGSMKVNRILTKQEVDAIVITAGRQPQEVEPRHSVRRGRSPMKPEDVAAGFLAARFLAGKETTAERGRTRSSVTSRGSVGLANVATALFAQQLLAGKEVSAEDADSLLKNIGLRAIPAPEILARAKDLAEKNREKVQRLVRDSTPELVEALVQSGLEAQFRDALDGAITGAAEAADPSVGREVQKAVQRHETRELMSARGFDAAQMMAELPIDLSKGLLSTADRVKTPKELAKLEEARKRREEERAAAEAEMTDEERLAAVDDPTYVPPSEESLALFKQLYDSAKFALEARQAEERRAAAEKAKRKAEGQQDESGEAADAAGSVPSAQADADALLPAETVARIAPVFDSPELFAQFLVEWTAKHVVERHPNIPSTAQMWKNPVAIRELKQTATGILRKLSRDCLGSPSLNYARNFVDHQINELESDAETRTYKAVLRKVAYVYDAIHANALRLKRRELVNRLVNGYRAKNPETGKTETVPGIRQLAGVKGRFSAVKEEFQRVIDARTEVWARQLVPLLTMGEERLASEIAEMERRLAADPTADDYVPMDDDARREMADRLALAKKYGGLVRRMPGEIADAADEILSDLNGRRQAFEQRRLERENEDKAVRDAIIDAMRAGSATDFRKPQGRLGRYADAMQGNLTLEMQNLVRFCRDPEKRQAALEAIETLQAWISEATGRYRVVLGEAQRELREGLAACYGSAEIGIRHLLKDELDPETAAKIFKSRDKVPTYGQLLQLYASSIQSDYRENAEKHGRTAALPIMEQTLTDADKAFHAFAVEWYKRNRRALSDAVEAVTGLPVTSPDALYCPVRVQTEADGFSADAVAWSPVPAALNRRVRHGLDFNEGVNFLSVLQEQAEIRAQTIGYSAVGIRLRDILAHRETQKAARETVGKGDIKTVLDHVKDVLVQNAAKKDESAFFAPLNIARKWIARFALAGNVPSALKQLASMPVWANAMLGGREIGLKRTMHYLATVGTDEGRAAIRDLVESDGFKARYTMGWSEETQNILMNPSKSRLLRHVEKAYDKSMIVNKAVDAVSCLWMAQGFYRDARAHFLSKGISPDEAKRMALAMTWSVCESGQQSGRIENMNRLQRKGGAGVAAIFQFKTAYLLQNAYLIQAIKEWRAGTPGAMGRAIRAAFINCVWIPAFVQCVNLAWSALMGDEPPEKDPEKWPKWLKDFGWSMIDGVTAPMFGVSTAAHTAYDAVTGNWSWGQSSGIPAIDSAIRVTGDAVRAAADLFKTVTCLDAEEELTSEKLQKDVWRLLKDIAAPVRHGKRFYDNRWGDGAR